MAGRPHPKEMMSTSFRIEPHIWEAAREQARKDGVRVTEMVSDLVEGYVLGAYILPKRVFPAPAEGPEERLERPEESESVQ